LKILFSDTTYSYLFPGGKQVHAEKLFNNLKQIGVDVEYENWHDPKLEGNVIQFFGFNDFHKIKALKAKGYKLVYTHILDGLTNLSSTKLLYHKVKNKLINLLPEKFNVLFPWKALNYFDAIVYMHQNDMNTAINLYNVDPSKAFVIPHAVDSLEKFQGDITKGDAKFLISLGSIVERKNAVFTAKICKENKIPILFIGHPFDKSSAYYKEFLEQVDGTYVRYSGFVTEQEKVALLKKASGFVLLSFGESGCISVYEAGATGLPVLLSDLPWAKGYEKPNAIYFSSPTDKEKATKSLINFFKLSERKTFQTFSVHTWKEIAERYAAIYKKLLNQ